MNKSLLSSKKQDWEKPDWLFRELDNLFNFDIDVCANRYIVKINRHVN
ncbi:hypothetical protein [Metaclostridioides mangenotii]|uniref:Uncharacterized protein n=1 Tax=Metaclostridioides mangenotii TaxID=1540 RepID=A0ABS4E7I1_9FIRM|nr:hypothetical protein [Clostridioides mangenotii]MBP1853901.1 hypothetical protein [Clostridioides mangenotii]